MDFIHYSADYHHIHLQLLATLKFFLVSFWNFDQTPLSSLILITSTSDYIIPRVVSSRHTTWAVRRSGRCEEDRLHHWESPSSRWLYSLATWGCSPALHEVYEPRRFGRWRGGSLPWLQEDVRQEVGGLEHCSAE